MCVCHREKEKGTGMGVRNRDAINRESSHKSKVMLLAGSPVSSHNTIERWRLPERKAWNGLTSVIL